MDLNEVLKRTVRLQQMGRGAEAEIIYQKLLEQDSNSAPILCLYGRFLRLEKREDEAKGVLRRARELAPQSPQVHSELGLLAVAQSNMVGAVSWFKYVLDLKPDYADGYHNLGSAYQAIGDYSAAVVCFKKAIELNLSDPNEAYCNLGFALAQTGDTTGAIDSLSRVLTSNPNDPRAIFGLGIVSVMRGNFNEALEKYRRVIGIDPTFVAAYQQLAFAKKFRTVDDPDLQSILACLDQPNLSAEYKEKIAYGAGKALDDCGEYEKAAKFFRSANDLKKTRLGSFDFRAFESLVDKSIALANYEFSGNKSIMPIFVIGLPRSGSTLVEQVLSSHNEISGAGEVDYFARKVAAELSPYPESLKAKPEQLARIADDYLEILSSHSGGRPHVVDKYPLNFQYLGLLSTLFPNARFIHCCRNPLDNALSIYFQDFATANLYANDIKDIHRFYSGYKRLMTHWMDDLDSKIFDINYEDLVSDSKTVISQLLDFLKLPFDPQCMSHTENKRVIQTLSSWQVRQPIYQSSKERWRNYAEFIPELVELFESQAIGYRPQVSRKNGEI